MTDHFTQEITFRKFSAASNVYSKIGFCFDIVEPTEKQICIIFISVKRNGTESHKT